MARRCELTGKGVMSGNKVSHSNRKTRRRFLPNIQTVSFHSEALGRAVTLRIAASTVRSVEHNDGIDKYLLSTTDSKLGKKALAAKRDIEKALAAKAA